MNFQEKSFGVRLPLAVANPPRKEPPQERTFLAGATDRRTRQPEFGIGVPTLLGVLVVVNTQLKVVSGPGDKPYG